MTSSPRPLPSPSPSNENGAPPPVETEDQLRGLQLQEQKQSNEEKMEAGGEGNGVREVRGDGDGKAAAAEEEDEEEEIGSVSAGGEEEQSPASSSETGDGPEKEIKREQREEFESVSGDCNEKSKAAEDTIDKSSTTGGLTSEHAKKRRASVEISSSDGEPLSRMDSEDSISSTLMDMDSTASSGRSTPAMMNGQGSTTPSTKSIAYNCCWDQCQTCFNSSPDLAEHIRSIHVDGQRGGLTTLFGSKSRKFRLKAVLSKHTMCFSSISSTLMDMDSTASSGRSTPAMMNGQGSTTPSTKSIAYNCCWDQCQTCFNSSPDLAEHIRSFHVDGQRGGVFVCLWKGCKVYNTPSTSQSWLQRHMLTHSGDKPFKVCGGNPLHRMVLIKSEACIAIYTLHCKNIVYKRVEAIRPILLDSRISSSSFLKDPRVSASTA
ncbi:UNVERIFIED_CONTAM: hypothetical protein FKN15_019471 [Acipenser sinensis]